MRRTPGSRSNAVQFFPRSHQSYPSEASSVTPAFEQRNRVVAALVFLFVLLIYIRTVAPTVSFWDAGEFIATSYILGVPHPPGAPLYTLLGRTFSMLPFADEIAFRVNFLSVLAAAVTVLLVYLCVVRLLRNWLDPSHPVHRLAILTGGAVAALCTAFSTAFWSNATEAEVYALSMCFTLFAFWLALRWDETYRDLRSDRLLLLIAYLFGLGAGVHLQCILTFPGVLILVFSDLMKERPIGQQTGTVAALFCCPFLVILLPLPAWVTVGFMALAILAALAFLRPAWRHPWFWIWAILLAALGYSTYYALYLRSGLNPLIDMNNPETLKNFTAFFTREQYGAHAVFPRRGEFWAYQLNIHFKYFLQQFPHLLETAGIFRRATASAASNYEVVRYSFIPLLLGIGGALYHVQRDWRRFASVFAMFALMGVGLVLYLNMPDPEPRERNYIFVGAYTFFACWIGIGAAGLIACVASMSRPVEKAVALALATLLVPLGILEKNYFSHDRSRDYIAHDYAYNILHSCEPNAILFTNGDNDTYPLWFLQYVKGFRTDVRVANLSLIKTPWYVKQLQDLEPSISLGMSHEQIERETAPRRWKPRDLKFSGLTVKAEDVPSADYYAPDTGTRVRVVETQTRMIWLVINQNNWERPVYFAVTVPSSNLAGLTSYLSMEGMAYRLVKHRAIGQLNLERSSQNLLHDYRYRSVADSTVYKDPVARRLLGNYLVLFDGLVRAYLLKGQYSDAFHALQRAERLVPPSALDPPDAWDPLANRYRDIAVGYARAGSLDSAMVSMEALIKTNPHVEKQEEIEALLNLWKSEKQARD